MMLDVTEKPFLVTLPGRGLIRITGPDRRGFLDALVSNDLNVLDTQSGLYACLLTPQGKFLYDFIIHEDGDALILDCEGGDRLAGLMQKLKLYKLRSKIDLECIDNKPVYAILPPIQNTPSPMIWGRGGDAYPDPRHPSLGYRTLTKPENLEDRPFAAWDTHRIRLCIPDGSRDMVPEQSTLIECRVDTLNGVSFDKGCYIGQELTARMHHRGLAKKHLYTVEWREEPPAPGTDIHIDGMLAGQTRSACGRTGLALLKDETAKAMPPHAPFRLVL